MRAQRSVLLISHGRRIGPPVVVLYDGSASAEQALVLASRLVQELSGSLSILVPANAPRSSKELQAQIAERLSGESLVIHYRELMGSGVITLISAVQAERCGILVLSKATLSPDDVEELMDAVDCPVLLAQ
jgi:hypothetical protein